MYEAVYEVYKIIIPIHAAKRQFKDLEKIHVKLVDCFQNIVAKVNTLTFYNVCIIRTWIAERRETREVLELTTELVSMVPFLVKILTDKSSSTVSKVSPDWLNSL